MAPATEAAMKRNMGSRRARFNPAVAAAALLAGVGILAAPAAAAHWGAPALTSIEVFDRFDATTLPVYEHDGQRFIVGTPGHEYTVRIRNLTGERVLAVTSVDGVNVVTGETASPDQSGYVIDPYGSVDVNGWRKSLARTAAFYFTDLGDSYAARTSRPGNVGVIGVAVYRERPQRVLELAPREKIAAADAATAGSAPSNAQAPQSAAPAPLREDARDQPADARRSESVARAAPAPLGTGHGRSEASHATQVAFERASTTPAQTLAVRYDRRETLAAMGVLPDATRYARRAPQPFPGALRFVPDPR
jgi:hypothetical protein